MSHVVDASALTKTFLDEAGSDAFRAFLRDVIDEGRTLLAPRLLQYELGNIVTFQFPEAEGDRRAGILEDALALVRTERVDDPGAIFGLLPEAGTHYDANYLRLAQRQEAELVTYDEGLAEAAREHGVPTRRPGSPG